MKFRRTASSVIASVALVLAVLMTVVYFRLSAFGIDRVRDLVRSVLPSGDSGIEISADGMESTLMKSLTVNGISVKAGDSRVAYIPSVDISMTIWDVVRIAIWKGAAGISVTVNDPVVNVDDEAVRVFTEMLESGSNSGTDNEMNDDKADASASGGLFDNVGISVSVRNMSLSAEYQGISLSSEGINATAEVGTGLVFAGADINMPQVSLTGAVPGGSEIVVEDLRGSVDGDFGVKLSIAGASFRSIAWLSELSAISTISDDSVYVALYSRKALADLEELDIDADFSVDGATLSLTYVFGTGEMSATARLEELVGRYRDASFSISDLAASGSYDGKKEMKATAGLNAIDVSYQGYRLHSEGLSLSLSHDHETQRNLGQAGIRSLSVSGFEDMGLSGLMAADLFADVSYSPSGFDLVLRTTAGGHHDNELTGDFRATIDASLQTSDFKRMDYVSVDISDMSLSSVPGTAGLSFRLNEDRSLTASFSVGDDASGSVSYAGGYLESSLYITDLAPAGYKVFFDTFLAGTGFVVPTTSVSGNMVVNADLTDSYSGWIGDVLEGVYSDIPVTETVFDILSNGRVSLNAAVRDVQVGDGLHNAALSFEATVDSAVADINTLALTAEGFRLSYVGQMDFADMVPFGNLLLQNAEDGSELAHMVFEHEMGSKSYRYSLTSPLLEDTGFSGNVDWHNSSVISSDAVLVTPYLEGDLELRATLELDPLHLSVTGNKLELEADMDGGNVTASGQIKELSVNASDTMKVTVDSLLDAYFSADDLGYGISFRNLAVKVSEKLDASLDLELTDHSILIENITIDTAGRHELFDGRIDFTFPGVGSLMGLETSGVEGIVDLRSTDGVLSLQASAKDNQFFLDLRLDEQTQDGLKAKLSALGRREGSIYAAANLSWGAGDSNNVVLNAMYDDRRISIYDSEGTIGTLDIGNIKLDADLIAMTVDASMELVNSIPTKTGSNSVQKGRFALSARGESISDSLIQLFAGQDYRFDFTVLITDVELEDGYEIADLTIDTALENGVLTFSGNMVKGSFDIDSGYLDISIDRELLFGFNARGYVGKELDLMVSDLIFPLPILNQFINDTTFAFADGTVEGDVLVKGPLSNPSLYGMAYCRSYEMTLFYLPDQIMSVKNVAVSLHDHELKIARSPLSGYSESDGRYFYGDVAVDMVLQGMRVETFDVDVNIDSSTPIYFWLPMHLDDNFDMEFKGDVTGKVIMSMGTGGQKLTTDIRASDMLIDFRFDEEMPDWFYEDGEPIDMDITLTTGKDVEAYYPEKENPFINFTLSEDRTMRLISDNGVIRTDGGLSLKTGQVFYFNNDFIIKEGSVDLTEKKLSGNNSDVPIVLNLTAEITDYDSDGRKVVIQMILQNSTIDNLNPRFTSTPMMTENEILAMLGQSVMASGALDQNLSLSSIATFAATATETLTRVGMLESNNNYSISGTIRNALGLDIFSVRSSILSNIIVDALPGELAGRGDISLLARYLDGTSVFAGRYIGLDWFIKIRLMLKADNRVKFRSNVGNFLSRDLILDTEISLDWDTKLGTWSVFTNPRELSVFDILDTIGFSVTKQIQF